MLGVHVDDLIGGGNLAFGLNLNLEPGSKVDFDFVVESCVKNTIENPRQSLFQKWNPFLFLNM